MQIRIDDPHRLGFGIQGLHQIEPGIGPFENHSVKTDRAARAIAALGRVQSFSLSVLSES
jgi:hypothetical protein